MVKFRSKGIMTFLLSDDLELAYIKKTANEIIAQYQYHESIRQTIKDSMFTREIYHLISGPEFLHMIRNHLIIDNDGSIADVFVDGFRSNLGICEAGFQQGEFLVTGTAFETLCEKHEITINWANK